MPPKVQAASAATFSTDDKRAQYARLVVFNHGVKEKLISKDKDVNTVSQGDLQKAFKSLVGGTLLAGTGGIELITALSKKGATDPNVSANGLTKAYAQEVRPFIMRGTLSETFGRRGGGPRAPRAAGSKKTSATKTRASGSKKKASATRGSKKNAATRGSKKASATRSSRRGATPAPAAAPAAEEGSTEA